MLMGMSVSSVVEATRGVAMAMAMVQILVGMFMLVAVGMPMPDALMSVAVAAGMAVSVVEILVRVPVALQVLFHVSVRVTTTPVAGHQQPPSRPGQQSHSHPVGGPWGHRADRRGRDHSAPPPRGPLRSTRAPRVPLGVARGPLTLFPGRALYPPTPYPDAGAPLPLPPPRHRSSLRSATWRSLWARVSMTHKLGGSSPGSTVREQRAALLTGARDPLRPRCAETWQSRLELPRDQEEVPLRPAPRCPLPTWRRPGDGARPCRRPRPPAPPPARPGPPARMRTAGGHPRGRRAQGS